MKSYIIIFLLYIIILNIKEDDGTSIFKSTLNPIYDRKEEKAMEKKTNNLKGTIIRGTASAALIMAVYAWLIHAGALKWKYGRGPKSLKAITLLCMTTIAGLGAGDIIGKIILEDDLLGEKVKKLLKSYQNYLKKVCHHTTDSTRRMRDAIKKAFDREEAQVDYISDDDFGTEGIDDSASYIDSLIESGQCRVMHISEVDNDEFNKSLDTVNANFEETSRQLEKTSKEIDQKLDELNQMFKEFNKPDDNDDLEI